MYVHRIIMFSGFIVRNMGTAVISFAQTIPYGAAALQNGTPRSALEMPKASRVKPRRR
jgi:hypothetical protein